MSKASANSSLNVIVVNPCPFINLPIAIHITIVTLLIGNEQLRIGTLAEKRKFRMELRVITSAYDLEQAAMYRQAIQ